MKKIVFILCTLCISILSFSQEMANVSEKTTASLKKAEISLKEDTYDFGTIKLNEPVNHTFIVTNTGNIPLIINNVVTTCGCTATEYPKEAVLPNKTANITITYDSSNKGAFSKSARILSNAENEIVLKIKGVVE